MVSRITLFRRFGYPAVTVARIRSGSPKKAGRDPAPVRDASADGVVGSRSKPAPSDADSSAAVRATKAGIVRPGRPHLPFALEGGIAAFRGSDIGRVTLPSVTRKVMDVDIVDATPVPAIPVTEAGLSVPHVAPCTIAAPPSEPASATQRAVTPLAPERSTSGTPSILSLSLDPPLSCIE